MSDKREHKEGRKNGNFHYAHIFDGDFDYRRWEGNVESPAERKRKVQKDYAMRVRSGDFKRKNG